MRFSLVHNTEPDKRRTADCGGGDGGGVRLFSRVNSGAATTPPSGDTLMLR